MTARPTLQPLQGAYIDQDALIGARFQARDLDLRQRKRALNVLAGHNKSTFRGRGLDFEEVRAYQAGDDIRTIDWRVTARSGKPHTKLFREERERPVLIAVDQRQGMFFGSQHCFKSVSAAYTGALLAWASLQSGDRVGGLVFGNEGHREIRPSRNRRNVLALMHRLATCNGELDRHGGRDLEAGPRLAQALAELRRIARPGSAIYLLSDFAGAEHPDTQKHLHHLARHCEITGLFCFDRLERELPPPGQYTITDGRRRHTLFTGPRPLREAYRHAFYQRVGELHHQLGQIGVPLIELSTDDVPLRRLARYYHSR